MSENLNYNFYKKFLSEIKVKKIYYIPLFMNFSLKIFFFYIFKYYKEKNIIFIESFLTFKDIFRSYFLTFKINKNYRFILKREAYMNPFKTILVFSHVHNSFDKKTLLGQGANNPFVKLSDVKVDDFVKEPDIKEFFMDNCLYCGKATKDSLFGSDRALKFPDGKVHNFCTSSCRENYKRDNNLEVFDKKP